jgi:hypothetical protein
VAEAVMEGSSLGAIAAATAAGLLLVARGGTSARCFADVVER